MSLRNYIKSEQFEAAEAALLAAQTTALEEKDPILLKILTGISAWVASLFLLGFVAVAITPEENTILFFGAIIAGLAILVHHQAKNAGTFVEQATLSCMMCAHLMLLFGMLANFGRSDEQLTLAVTQTLLCALPLWAFRRPAYQASSLLLAACLWTYYAVEINSPALFRLFLAVEVCAFGALTLWRTRRSPFIYSLALAIGVTIFFLDWVQSLFWLEPFNERLWPANFIMAALLAAIGGRFLAPTNWRQPKILVLYGMLLLLAFLSSPGLLFAIALLILGYGLRDPIFSGLGIIGLPCFIIYFYYSLQVSLLEKSGILAASGIICLLAAYWAHASVKSHTKREGAQS
ncbi:DUF4401 domain-containing protein [Coraliomargarita sp. W4R53]